MTELQATRLALDTGAEADYDRGWWDGYTASSVEQGETIRQLEMRLTMLDNELRDLYLTQTDRDVEHRC